MEKLILFMGEIQTEGYKQNPQSYIEGIQMLFKFHMHNLFKEGND